MSFDLYFVGVPSLEYGVEKFLYNQYDDRSKIKNLYSELVKPNNKVFLDSGAFPAFTRGIVVDIDEYINYINANNDVLTVVASLDVIPKTRNKNDIECAAIKSWDNFLYMRKRVVCKEKLIPTFHQTEPLSYLRNILEFEDEFGKIDYFALGAMANSSDPVGRTNFLSECFTVISSIRPNIKVHAFGMTDLTLLELFPFYSADSTTYTIAAGMGEIITKFGRIAVSSLRSNSTRYALKSKYEIELLREYVSGFGYDLDVLIESRNERVKFNISYLQDWEKHRICRYNKIAKAHKLF